MNTRFAYGALAAAAALAMAAPRAFADDIVTVNPDREARRPVIVSDGKAGLHIAYVSYDRTNKVPDVFHTMSTDWGKTWEPAVNVGKHTGGISSDPQIACGKDGQLQIVWTDTAMGIERPNIYGCSSTDGGRTWNKAQNISGTPGKSMDPAIAIAQDGTVHCVWADTTDNDTGPEIWHAMSADKGATWTRGVNISHTLGDARAPSIACGAKGEVFCSWIDKLSVSRSPDVIFTSSIDGGKSFTRAVHIANTRGLHGDPVIATDEKGVYLAWADVSARTGKHNILFAVSRDAGKTWEKPIDIATTPGFSSQPAICAADGRVGVVWRDTSGHEANPDIWMAISHDFGKSFADPRNVSNTTGDCKHPDLAIVGGNVYVVWQEYERGYDRTKLIGTPLR
jgi:hypothetical protein